jgi:acyl-coenzyme A thioesterase PaaI-like protein
MQKEIPNIYIEQGCFFCGSNNPVGLKLRFYLDEEAGEVSTEYKASRLFVGLGNILHGGIQAGLFDEIMGWTAHNILKEMGVTTELTMQFLSPAYVDTTLRVSCHIIYREGPKAHMEARIETLEGTLCSKATGIYHMLPQEKFNKIIFDQH